MTSAIVGLGLVTSIYGSREGTRGVAMLTGGRT